jgi:hypothetical protein
MYSGRELEVMAASYGLIGLTVYGREENWEDSRAGWPQGPPADANQWRTNGRPVSPWSRVDAGRSDDLGT